MSHVIAAVSTGSQISAIGILRLSGSGCGQVAGQVFRAQNGRPLTEAPNRKLILGTLLDRQGRTLDQCMAVYTRGPHSYTGEDTVELHCHGSPAVLAAGLEALYQAGARPAGRGEFTKRAFLNGRMDLTQAEAVIDLIEAETADAAANAAGQVGGALTARLEPVYEVLTDLCSHFHAVLDYPDEEIDAFSLASYEDALSGAQETLQALLATANRGRVLRNGVRAVILGKPNVGKSSLLNALCGEQIFEADMLFATLDPTARKLTLPSGLQTVLVDTVGFVSRLPHHLVEAFKSTLEEAAYADVIVKVADASDPQAPEQLAVTDEVLATLDCGGIPQLVVYNKCDAANLIPLDPGLLLTSARTGRGLPELLARLDEVLAHRVRGIEVLLPYDKLALADVLRSRGSVAAEEYRETGVYYRATVKIDDLHRFEPYLV